MRLKFRALRTPVVLTTIVLLVTTFIPGASAGRTSVDLSLRLAAHAAIPVPVDKFRPEPSGIYDFKEIHYGVGITECPQAGNDGTEPQPLNLHRKDTIEQLSERGDDKRTNQDSTCFPQNEVSVDTNPRNPKNFVVGANDYRLGTGSSGFHVTTNGGRSWYDGIIPFPSGPASQTRGEGIVPSGGDPVIVFDSAGVVYFAQIGFFRGDDTNGVFVQRSTNGGFTWSRACIPIDATPGDPTDDKAVCGSLGDARQPGDGRVSFNPDNDRFANGSVPFDDKEYMAAGPRPPGVNPVCFAPITRKVEPCNPTVIGTDRLYVTFTRFAPQSSQILLSYSDDQGRSWSLPQPISGSANFCTNSRLSARGCDDNQFSYPTVNPTTGVLYVQFENFNAPDENQILVVRSRDGGNTFEGPFFVTSVFDLNFPRAGITRPDCAARGAQPGRIVYTNSCFRSNAAGTITVDKRGGAFADDLYLVIADNRNGTVAVSNSDVFLFKSIDGGLTWIGPTRVNDDRSDLGGVSRDCARLEGGPYNGDNLEPCHGDFGNDQWWPWVDIGEGGELNIAFKDRRLDIDSINHEWPSSRQQPGNYLVWTWGAQCRVTKPDSRECLAPSAGVIVQPTAPVNPGNDPVPGQGVQFVGSFLNFQVSDVPSNYDYSFRSGLFAGDYEAIAVFSGASDDDGDDGALAINVFTDARNGRSSKKQPGRNPICEQSDIFFDVYSATKARADSETRNYSAFLSTPCPVEAIEPQDDDDDGPGEDD